MKRVNRLPVPGKKLTSKIREYYYLPQEKGQISVELELEGHRGDYVLDPHWTTHAEGTLGPTGVEFVLRRPVIKENFAKAMELWRMMLKNEKLKVSNRGGTHIHINAQEYTLEQVYKIFGCFWIFEPLLVKANGEAREGNCFCLRAGDAENVVYELIRTLDDRSFFGGIKGDTLRYAALNPESLGKFGSLEFRFIEGTTDSELVTKWGLGLQHFVERAAETDLDEFLDRVGISVGGLQDQLLYEYFGPLAPVLCAVEERNNILMEGYCYTFRLNHALRNAQQYYCFETPEHEDFRSEFDEDTQQEFKPDIKRPDEIIAWEIPEEPAWEPRLVIKKVRNANYIRLGEQDEEA